VAPPLSRAVPPGLAALARGSLLQTYALAVGVGRLSADPVLEAARLLVRCDDDGEPRVRRALRAWPERLRRRIGPQVRRGRSPRTADPLSVSAEAGSAELGSDPWFRLATAVIAEAGGQVAGLTGEARLQRLMQLARGRLQP